MPSLHCGFSVVCIVGAAALFTQSSVTILGSQTPGTATYSYSISNQSNRAIVLVQIGNDLTKGKCELVNAPAGWTKASGTPLDSVTTPSGWTIGAFIDEGTGRVCVVLKADEHSDAWDIAGGASLGGFSVTASSPDGSYLSAPVTVYFDDGSSVLTRVGQ